MAKTIGYVPAAQAAEACIGWARFAALRSAEREGLEPESVDYLCADPSGSAETVDAVNAALGGEAVSVEALPQIEALATAMERTRAAKAEMLVTSVAGLPREFAVDTARRVLKTSPCATLVALWGTSPPESVRRVLVILSDSVHDETLFRLARSLSTTQGAAITVARIEADVGGGAQAVGERELQRFLHEVAADDDDQVETKVVVDNHPVRGVVSCYEDHDLVVVGSSDLDLVKALDHALPRAVVAVVKRTPPLRRRRLPDWIPQVNPSDYAELVQTLRQGSRWNADFVVMLGLASAIATLGLIQDSAAVVIGSMLLAPLMTPMLGFGLALAQANGSMAKRSGRAILQGFLLTLLISYVLGHLSFWETLSPEILSRGRPNILDLGIALFAAMAAAFALARPSITGAVAGVAIATALVPPVCACGVSLAVGYGLNALGAAVLFFTNLLAIVLASAVTFLLMGIAVPHSFSRARRIARHGFGAITLVLLLLALPLGMELGAQLDEGRARPIAFPVSRSVSRALRARIAQDEGVRIMMLGRTSVRDAVVIWLAMDHEIQESYQEELRALVRAEMNAPELEVEVLAVQSAMPE